VGGRSTNPVLFKLLDAVYLDGYGYKIDKSFRHFLIAIACYYSTVLYILVFAVRFTCNLLLQLRMGGFKII